MARMRSTKVESRVDRSVMGWTRCRGESGALVGGELVELGGGPEPADVDPALVAGERTGGRVGGWCGHRLIIPMRSRLASLAALRLSVASCSWA